MLRKTALERRYLSGISWQSVELLCILEQLVLLTATRHGASPVAVNTMKAGYVNTASDCDSVKFVVLKPPKITLSCSEFSPVPCVPSSPLPSRYFGCLYQKIFLNVHE